jgi:ribosomal protein L11 methyltransferase
MESQITHRPPKRWLKISLQVPVEFSESLAGFLALLSGSGIEILAVGDSFEKIIVYLAEDEDLENKKNALSEYLERLKGTFPPEKKISLVQEQLLEEDWGRSWKSHFKAVRITSRLAIKPSWETYQPVENESVIELDPGMAFGTGLHASTRLSLELIEECYPPADPGPLRILDVGTGTGILAMACALLGANKISALDNDPDAVQIASENIAKNHLEEKIRVSSTDLRDLNCCFELVVANIIHDTLVELAPVLRRLLTENGFLILAGILKGEQEKSILATFRKLGLTLLDTRYREEWVAFRFTSEGISPT